MPHLFRIALAIVLSILPMFAPAQTAPVPAASVKDTILFDFEKGTYDGWTLEGDCWGKEPASEALFPGRIKGFGGKRFVCTLNPKLGTGAKGKAVSREFTIDQPFLTFKIGGGHYPGAACLNLLIDGKIVRTETGSDSPELTPAYWDVYALMGKKAHIEIVDSTASTDRGYIMVDDVVLSERPNTRKQAILEKYVHEYRISHYLPALMAVISVRGKIAAVVADGVRELGKPERATIYDRVRVGSVSKSITGTLMGALVEKGIIRWDTKVGDVFPEFRTKYGNHSVLNATLIQLLCHRGGMERQAVMYNKYWNLPAPQWRLRYLTEVLSKPAAARPGEKYIYGPGHTLAVAMVERLTRSTYENLFTSTLCDPLGIKSFGMGDPTDSKDEATVVAALKDHIIDYRDRSIVKPAGRFNDYLKNCPTAGINMTILDLLRIEQLHLGIAQTSARLIGERNLQIMHTDPYLDGACDGLFKEREGNDEWFGHSGNTGCGDFSKISINLTDGVVCFFNTNANSLGMQPNIDYPDFLQRFRHIALHE